MNTTSYEFSAELENFPESPVWGFHIIVPEVIVTALRENKNTRTIAVVNNAISIHCALMSNGNGEYFIMLNKQNRSKLKINRGDILTISIRKDESKYGMEMPEEFSELLSLDEEGNTFFHALTPGKQRSLIHVVGKSNQSETRIKKALVILDYLKFTQGKLDFNELSQAFKHSNRV